MAKRRRANNNSLQNTFIRSVQTATTKMIFAKEWIHIYFFSEDGRWSTYCKDWWKILRNKLRSAMYSVHIFIRRCITHHFVRIRFRIVNQAKVYTQRVAHLRHSTTVNLGAHVSRMNIDIFIGIFIWTINISFYTSDHRQFWVICQNNNNKTIQFVHLIHRALHYSPPAPPPTTTKPFKRWDF